MRAVRVLRSGALALGIRLALPALAALAAFVAPSAHASLSIAISFEDLIRGSSAAVVVTPDAESVVWEDGRIITYTEVHIDDLVAGTVAGQSAVWIRTRGGDIGHLGQSVLGEAVLTMGRATLLFIRLPRSGATEVASRGPYVVTGRAQGQFPIVEDGHGGLAFRASTGVDEVVKKVADLHPLARDVLQGRRVADAEATVSRAWQGLHAP